MKKWADQSTLIHGFFASSEVNAAGCPLLPESLGNVALDSKISLGSPREQVQRLGSPTVVKGGWIIFGSEKIISDDVVEAGELMLRLKGGRVVELWATLQAVER